jgi:hypothetical protein
LLQDKADGSADAADQCQAEKSTSCEGKALESNSKVNCN